MSCDKDDIIGHMNLLLESRRVMAHWVAHNLKLDDDLLEETHENLRKKS